MSRRDIDQSDGKGHSRHASKLASGASFSEVAKQGSEMRLIAGPCLLESVDHGWRMAEALAEIATDLHIDFFMFKASVRKQNRTRGDSPRGGVGAKDAKELFARISKTFGYPCVTDVHSWDEAHQWGTQGLVLQVPALLSRQTDIIENAAEYAKTGIHIKKGQFMSPYDVKWAVEKVRENNKEAYIMVSERGYSFGYNNLVVDMRSFPILRNTTSADEILFDATHSVQMPSGPTGISGGQRELIEPLARAALAAGADGLFCEVHDDPDKALSDGPCQIPLKHFAEFLKPLLELHAWATENPFKSLDP